MTHIPTYQELENQIAELKKQNELLHLNFLIQNKEKIKRAKELIIANLKIICKGLLIQHFYLLKKMFWTVLYKNIYNLFKFTKFKQNIDVNLITYYANVKTKKYFINNHIIIFCKYPFCVRYIKFQIKLLGQ